MAKRGVTEWVLRAVQALHEDSTVAVVTRARVSHYVQYWSRGRVLPHSVRACMSRLVAAGVLEEVKAGLRTTGYGRGRAR